MGARLREEAPDRTGGRSGGFASSLRGSSRTTSYSYADTRLPNAATVETRLFTSVTCGQQARTGPHRKDDDPKSAATVRPYA
jgi:hypothetical protein